MRQLRNPIISTLIICCNLVILSSSHAKEADWADTYYQYRMPVVLEVKNTGWNIVPVDEEAITSKINKIEEFQFDPLWFAYNQVKVVEVDDSGEVVDANPVAGFYLVPVGDELFTESISDTAKTQEIEIPSEAGEYYLVTHRTEGGGKSPVFHYEQIHPVGSPKRKYANISSYEPPFLPKRLASHERLLISDGKPLVIRPKYRFVRGVKGISVRKIRVVFLIDIKEPGKKNLMLYYQPIGSHHLTIPRLRHAEVPAQTARVKRIGSAEKYVGKTKYCVGSNDFFRAWFAESTVKLTPNTPAPQQLSTGIKITCAKNEAQSFQIVINPKRSLTFKNIEVADLKNGSDMIPAEYISMYALDYVPIRRKSYLTPAKYIGPIGDPLVAVSAKKLSPMSGNYAVWLTVKVPADARTGTYNSTVTITGEDGVLMTIPFALEVYDFELPEFATLQGSYGGQLFAIDAKGGQKTIMDYHGLKTKQELKKLVRKYYDLMAVNKFYPKTVTTFAEIGMNWSPPPEGYNVDKPGNYFRLYDWDFTEFNRELQHYIDDLKVNTVVLTHTEPKSTNLFYHLPGKELGGFAQRDTSIHFNPRPTMAWETFRERTFVAYGRKEGDYYYDRSIEVSQDQFDHLIIDYYRELAKNLEKHGWLDKFYICVDEAPHMKRFLHFLKVLNSNPLTAKIKVVTCVQSLQYLWYKENRAAEEYAFSKRMTYMPQIDENYNRWEDYYFTDYDIGSGRDSLWSYVVRSARTAIDVPGINNRMFALDMFNKGGSGYFLWETFLWDNSHNVSDNPWEEPACRWGNGVLTYFYPPRKDGPSDTPDYTVTPSLRVMIHREGSDDYEYARILEDLIAEGTTKGIDVSEGKAVIKDIERFFYNSVHWSQNDAWYLDLRDHMAETIIHLKKRMN